MDIPKITSYIYRVYFYEHNLNLKPYVRISAYSVGLLRPLFQAVSYYPKVLSKKGSQNLGVSCKVASLKREEWQSVQRSSCLHAKGLLVPTSCLNLMLNLKTGAESKPL